MATVTDIKYGGVFKSWSAVATIGGDGCEAGEDVDFGECFGGSQELWNGDRDLVTKGVEEVQFECVSAVFGAGLCLRIP
jgi:hypothetical protein